MKKELLLAFVALSAMFASVPGMAGNGSERGITTETIGLLGYQSTQQASELAQVDFTAYKGRPQVRLHLTHQEPGAFWGPYEAGESIPSSAFTLDRNGYVIAHAHSADVVCGRFHHNVGQWIAAIGEGDFWDANAFHSTGKCLVRLVEVDPSNAVAGDRHAYNAYLDVIEVR
jgi:hypothetical protein